MNTQMTRKTLYISTVAQYKVREMIQVPAIEFAYAKLVNRVFEDQKPSLIHERQLTLKVL